jgi:lipoyl(octanoyl) transferase
LARWTTKSRSSLVGVWTDDHRKVCSIGMRFRRGVTTCGLHDVTMVSLADLSTEFGIHTELRTAVAAALDAV